MINEKELLQNAGAENVQGYCLVNNNGYTFNKNGCKYDLRHWLNCYGCDVDYYTLFEKTTTRMFDTFEQAIEYIAQI